ncbi:hypothetical protein L9F63_011841, partial [Diploptera punctata]
FKYNNSSIFQLIMRTLTISHDSRGQEIHKRVRTSMNSEGMADRCKKENSGNIHATKNELQCARIHKNNQLDDCELSSPPLLVEISDDEIKSHIDSDSIPDWNITFKQFLVHKQAVERYHPYLTSPANQSS